MNVRVVLVALLVVATAAFVVGVSLERSDGDTHDEATGSTEASEAAESGEAAEGEAGHAEAAKDKEAQPGGSTGTEGFEDETLLGVDLEATPFVVLAAAFSLALALAVWLRPLWLLLLAVVAAAMLVFAALDVREVIHQLDEDNGGLALLAGVVAALHLSAAAVALLMWRTPAGPPPHALA